MAGTKTDPIVIPVKVDNTEAKQQIDDVGKGFDGAKRGIFGATGAMRIFNTVIKAAGIGLLLSAITGIVDQFKQWQPAMDFINIQMAKLGAIFSTVAQRIMRFFETGSLEAFEGMGDQIKENVQAAEDLTKATIALDEAQIELTKNVANQRLEIAKLRNIANDESASLEDRLAAQQRAIELTEELITMETAQARERARILREQQDIGETTKEEMKTIKKSEKKVEAKPKKGKKLG